MSELRLSFGIPSLDQLFSSHDMQRSSGASKSLRLPTSVCMAGPSGGKSVLGMHLATHYYADCAVLTPWEQGLRPTVIHVFTDPSAAQAKEIWKSFALHRPIDREAPFPSEIAV